VLICDYENCFSVVKLNANRVVVGTLRGFDQFMNLVIDNTVEVSGNDKNDIGMVVCIDLLLSPPKILIPLILCTNYHNIIAGYQGEQCGHDRSP